MNIAPKISRELRDPEEARRFLLQGLWCQRVTPPAAGGVGPALALALEISAGGQPLPPVGFVADVASAAFDLGGASRSTRPFPSLPGVQSNLLRTYEDWHAAGSRSMRRN